MIIFVLGSLVLLMVVSMAIGALVVGRHERAEGLIVGALLGFQIWALIWTIIVAIHFISIYW